MRPNSQRQRKQNYQFSFCSCFFHASVADENLHLPRQVHKNISSVYCFTNHVHFCFMSLPSGKTEEPQFFLGSQYSPELCQCKGAHIVGQHWERGPSGPWGIWSHRLHYSTMGFSSHDSLHCRCSDHSWSTEFFWWHFLWSLLPRCPTHSFGVL